MCSTQIANTIHKRIVKALGRLGAGDGGPAGGPRRLSVSVHDSPVPGAPMVTRGVLPMVRRAPFVPNETDAPDLLRLTRTPGSTPKRRLKRSPDISLPTWAAGRLRTPDIRPRTARPTDRSASQKSGL